MLVFIRRVRPEVLCPELYRDTLPAGAQAAGAQAAGARSAGGTFQLAPLANAGDRAVTLAGADLHKNFGGIVAANGVDIELRAGQVTGLIGPNGAGKTTAFNLLTGFLPPTSGPQIGRASGRERGCKYV